MSLKRKALVSNIIIMLFAIAIFNMYDKYVASGVTSDIVFEEEFYERYLFKEYEGEDVDIARFTKLTLVVETLSQDFLNTLCGKGFGIFKGGKFLERSDYSVKILWLLTGTNTYLFFLLMQGGIVNTLIILILLFYPLVKSAEREVVLNEKTQSLRNLRYFIAAILIVILFYDVSLRDGAIVIIISSISMLTYNHKTYHNMEVKHQEMRLKSI